MNFRKANSGQVLIILSLGLIAMMACGALATDIGFFQNSRRSMQAAADSAAIAGEREVASGNSATAVAAARTDATLNGFTDGANSTSVTVNIPPASGAHASDPNAVEVIVKRSEPTYLLNVIGLKTVSVSARAVAVQQAAPGCIYALDPTADDSVRYVGVSLFYTNCGIIDDSNSPEALSFAIVSLVKAKSFGVVGGVSSFLLSLVSPQPVTGIPPAPDPFAKVAAPSFGGCDHTNYKLPLLGSATIDRGVYCGGITSPLASVGTLTLNPGLYVIRGGGLQVTGAAIIKNSQSGGDGSGGVTFFITGDATYPYKGVNLTGAVLNSLNAPTTGNYEGMLFFQDRTISSATAAANPNTIIGASLAKYQGILYFPTTSLIYGGANLSAYTILAADKVQFDLANITMIYSDYSSLAHGAPIKTAALAE